MISANVNKESNNLMTEFDPDKFRCETRLWSVAQLYKMSLDGELLYTPRKYNIYRASSYIEQCLTRTAVDYIKFYEEQDEDYKYRYNYVTYDGNCRLTLLVSYINGNYKLSELKIFEHVNNCKFQELSKAYQRRILETNINVFYIDKQTSIEYRNQVINNT